MKNALISAGFLLLCASRLALADIVVIVSQQSPVTSIDMHQARLIFMGKIGSFPDGRKVVVIDQPKSLLHDQFYLAVASKTSYQMASYWSRMMFTGAAMLPIQAATSEEVLRKVANDINAVGYVDSSVLNDKVKAVLRLPSP